jgi:hypothetical protein
MNPIMHLIAALAILSAAALQAATVSQNILPPPGREFSGTCVAVGNFMAIAGGGTNSDQGAVFVFGRQVAGENNWGLIRQKAVTKHPVAEKLFWTEVLGIDPGALAFAACGFAQFTGRFSMDRLT